MQWQVMGIVMGADGEKNTGRLRKYNERLFAVFGSLGAVLFITLLAMLAYSEVIKPLFRSSVGSVTNLISDEETQEAAEKGLRLQAASYEMARRLFEKLPYYVIPVGQRTLEKPEVLNAFSGNLLRDSGYYYGQDTNNLIVWNRNSGTTEIVLPERRSIGSWSGYIEEEIPYLLILSERIDTTLDAENQRANVTQTSDLVLWVYDLESGERTKIELPGKAGLELHTLDNSRLAFVLMGEYEAGSGVFDDEREPMYLYRVNAAAGVLTPVVPDELQDRIQNILDGSENTAK